MRAAGLDSIPAKSDLFISFGAPAEPKEDLTKAHDQSHQVKVARGTAPPFLLVVQLILLLQNHRLDAVVNLEQLLLRLTVRLLQVFEHVDPTERQGGQRQKSIHQ